jgi:hypothetical protein
MYIGLYVKYPLFLEDFNGMWTWSRDFRKMITSNFMEIRPEGEELFNADGRTQMTKLMVGFRNSAKAPEDRP